MAPPSPVPLQERQAVPGTHQERQEAPGKHREIQAKLQVLQALPCPCLAIPSHPESLLPAPVLFRGVSVLPWPEQVPQVQAKPSSHSPEGRVELPASRPVEAIRRLEVRLLQERHGHLRVVDPSSP